MTDINDDPTLDDDLAAELDPDDDPAAEDADAERTPARARYYAGRVDDGPAPYLGRLLVSRFPRGVLLIDKARSRAWLLDFDAAGGIYRCRNTAGMTLDEERRWRAADGADYEVRAFDADFDGDEVPSGERCPAPGCDEDESGAA